jgi:hypothetical protein
MTGSPFAVNLVWSLVDGKIEPFVALRDACDVLEAESMSVDRLPNIITPEDALHAMATQWREARNRLLQERGTVEVQPLPWWKRWKR